MFSNAKTLKTTAKKSKSEKAEVTIEGLEKLAAIDSMLKSLTAMKQVIEADVKDQARSYFIKNGTAIKKRPENFRGVEDEASASMELRIRSSASALSEEEAELLTKSGIEPVTVESVVETYVINPAYKDDAALLGKIEKKLKGVAGIPEDLFLKQEGVTKKVVPSDALDTLFTLNPITVNALFSVLGVLAVKPKMDNEDPDYTRTIVAKLLTEAEGD